MTKKLCPDTVQNLAKYAMAPGAETNGAHYGNQNYFFPKFIEYYR